ncbi:MAG TPA: anaerobic sulfatase maturase [Spirochaetales bacterium]|nr:anaerobic sulfatase maturase [Spirochaetales bacterium]
MLSLRLSCFRQLEYYMVMTGNSASSFSLLIKPASADCNLRCAYCFYLERCSLYGQTKRHRMSRDVLERIISSYMTTEQTQYSFGWQGGEPTLMGIDFFEKVVALQKKYGKAGAVVGNGVQTNATLIDDSLASFFESYNFLLGVSLDGPEKLHNTYRVSATGRGTHNRVVKSIQTLKKHSVEFNILTAVNSANVKKASEVYHYLLDNNLFFHQYIPIVEFGDNGESLPFSIRGGEWGEFLCTLFDEWVKFDVRRVSIRLFDAVLNLLVDSVRVVCTMGSNCCQYFVVEYNGDIYPCDFFVDSNKLLGNICSSDWQQLLESTAYRNFGARKSRLNSNCIECPYLQLCAGDCLKHRFYPSLEERQSSRAAGKRTETQEETQEGEGPDTLSWLCEGWKMFYKHSLPAFRRMAREVQRARGRERAQERSCSELKFNSC